MKIISFAWTSPALLAGRKSRTRRAWNDKYAARFKPGDMLQAYDRSPRFKGKPIAIIEVLNINYENIQTMTDEDYEREGFAYFEEQGLKIRGQVPRIAFAEWKHEGGFYYVLDFRLVSITSSVPLVGNSEKETALSTWKVRSKKTGVICHTSTAAEGAARWSERFLGEHGEVFKE
jgi:hypothetical protein